MKLLYFIMTAMVLVACTTNKPIAGKYGKTKSTGYVDYLFFNLKADSTFEYESKTFHQYEHSTGYYKLINKKNILLNSNIHFSTIPLKVTEVETNDSTNVITINVNIKGGESLSQYYCSLIVNDQPYFFNKKNFVYYKRCDSLSLLQIKGPIKTISFTIEKARHLTTTTSPALKTDIYLLKRPTNNKLICTIDCNESYFYYKPFNNETCKIKNNKLGFYNYAKKKWYFLPKVKPNSRLN